MSRKKQRENRRLKHYQMKIEKCNSNGIKDLTAYNAIRQIESKGKATIVYK